MNGKYYCRFWDTLCKRLVLLTIRAIPDSSSNAQYFLGIWFCSLPSLPGMALVASGVSGQPSFTEHCGACSTYPSFTLLKNTYSSILPPPVMLLIHGSFIYPVYSVYMDLRIHGLT